MKLLFFAQCARWCGRRELDVPIDGRMVLARLLETLPEAAPALERRAALRVAVNHEFSSFEAEVCDSDEVALLPPVSGG